MRNWKAAICGVVICTAIAASAFADTCTDNMIIKKNEKKHISGDMIVECDVTIDDDADWKNTGKLIMGNSRGRKQFLRPPKGKSIGHLVIGRSPALVELEGDLIADSVVINS